MDIGQNPQEISRKCQNNPCLACDTDAAAGSPEVPKPSSGRNMEPSTTVAERLTRSPHEGSSLSGLLGYCMMPRVEMAWRLDGCCVDF